MYKIYADDALIYDSTLEDYKIGKGSITLETNKSGSFTFSLYPDHYYYNRLVRLKTVIKVTRSGKIIFRGRILNDVTDYWNNKVFTCEGELGFLQDSIIRPFTFSGTSVDLFKKFLNDHNSQVDDFKKFKIGTVTVVDPNNYIARSNTSYETALSNLNSRLIEDSLGGYFYITHGEDGTEEIPTLNYLVDFTKISSQVVEFGSNLKDYTKTVTGKEIATALIPIGAETNPDTGEKLTIKSVNGGIDYIYDENAVALYGWIFRSVEWDDVTVASNLLTKGREKLAQIVKQNITIELNAIDLHLLDRSIESFYVGDYIRVISKPHSFDSTLLCNKQSIDLLKPDNDTLTLGYTYTTFTESAGKTAEAIAVIPNIRISVSNLGGKIAGLSKNVQKAQADASIAIKDYNQVVIDMNVVSNDLEAVAGVVVENTRNIATNAQNIATNAGNIRKTAMDLSTLTTRVETLENGVRGINETIGDMREEIGKVAKVIKDNLTDPLTAKNTNIADIIARIETLENKPDPTVSGKETPPDDNKETEGGGTTE